MQRFPVSSSDIRDIGYDVTTQTLEVGFIKGGVYQYSPVSESMYQVLMASASKGSFFHAHIKQHNPRRV
jgi:hypothetical protein